MDPESANQVHFEHPSGRSCTRNLLEARSDASVSDNGILQTNRAFAFVQFTLTVYYTPHALSSLRQTD